MTNTFTVLCIHINLVTTERYTVACAEVRAMDVDETTHTKDDNDSSSTGNDEPENKHDSSEVFDGKADFTVGKSPRNDTSPSVGERTIGVSGLGEGSPKVIVSAILFNKHMNSYHPEDLLAPSCSRVRDQQTCFVMIFLENHLRELGNWYHSYPLCYL